MKRLNIFLIRTYIGPFLLTFFLVIFILLMQFLWKYIDDLVGKGLSIQVISQLLMYVSTSLVPMALPLAILLSSIMTFGNMGENSELTAIKAAGISLQRFMRPLIILTFILGIAAFLFSNYVMPYTNLKMRSLIYDVQKQRPELQIKPGVFYNGIEGYSIRVSNKDYKTNMLRQLKIYDHSKGLGNTTVTTADSGFMKVTSDKRYLVVTLFKGYNYDESVEGNYGRFKSYNHPFRRDKFSKEVIMLELPGFGLVRTDESLFKSGYQMMNLKQLDHTTDSISKIINQSMAFSAGNTIQSNIFQTSNYYRPPQASVTSPAQAPVKKAVKHPDFYKLYAGLSAQDKQRVAAQALSSARNAKYNIDESKLMTEDIIKRLRRYEIEWHRKFTLSLACFIFFFIGAPLGAIIRKGGIGMPLVISVLFFVIYYVISMSGEKFAREDVVTVFNGMWISSMILLPIGAFLTYKATTDSVLLNTETYTEFFKKYLYPKKVNKFFRTYLFGK
ncbi:MAG: LptF/LptG family permease [Bacteroidota bacterium]|nr:LptF/LptG family permease [Bacteroidota bacterium]